MYLFGGKFCMLADGSRECKCSEIIERHPKCVCDRKHFNNILWATVTVFQVSLRPAKVWAAYRDVSGHGSLVSYLRVLVVSCTDLLDWLVLVSWNVAPFVLVVIVFYG